MIKKNAMRENSKGSNKKRIMNQSDSAKRLVISFAVSLMFFVLCLILIRNLTIEEEKVSVLVTLKTVPDNLKITEQSLEGYFTVREIPVSLVPQKAVSISGNIIGEFISRELSGNHIVTYNDVARKEDAAVSMKEPVEVSIGGTNVAQMVGGTLREGDYINISSVKEISAGDYLSRRFMNEVIAEKVYVTAVFTNAGGGIASEDCETAAVVANILIPAETESQFNAAMADGTLRVSRICR